MTQAVTAENPVYIGEDRELLFRVTDPDVRVELITPAATGATTLNVRSLDYALANGDKLLFGANTVVTVSGAVDAGTQLITLSAGLPGALTVGQRGQKIVNVTGYALEWELLDEPGVAVALITKTTAGGGVVLSSPTLGLVRVLLEDTDTLTLDPGVYFHHLRRTDAGSERRLASGDFHLAQAGE